MVVPRGHGVAPREAVLGLGAALGEAEAHVYAHTHPRLTTPKASLICIPWGGMRDRNMWAYPNFLL